MLRWSELGFYVVVAGFIWILVEVDRARVR